MTQLSKMLVEFDIEEFLSDGFQTRDEVVPKLNDLKNVLATAFQASVQMSTDKDFTYVTYEVYVATTRAPAVRELLEWITTADVKMETPATVSFELVYINSTPRFAQRVIDFMQGAGANFDGRHTTSDGYGAMVFKFAAAEPIDRKTITNYLHLIANTEGVELLEPKKSEPKVLPSGSVECPHCKLGFDPSVIKQHIREKH